MGHDQWDIYERADHVGGLASSYTDEHGFIWDHGGHVMFSHYTYFDDLVEKMLRGDYDQHMREAWVWMCGRFVPYPFQNNIHRLPPDVFLECVMGIIESQKSTLPREHFDAVDQRHLRRRHRTPFHAAVQLQGVGPPARDDVDVVAGRPGADVDVERILQNLLADRDDVSWGPNNMFKFPLLGTGMLYDRMAEALAEGGQPRAVRRSTSTSPPRW